jgi:RNA polymerase sigma factor (sigma-70 family)
VFRRARQILGDRHEAEEIVQELFAALIAEPQMLMRASSPAAWFYTTTTNRCINRLRDRRNRARLLALHAPSPAAAPASAEDAAVLGDVLAGLPDDLARVAMHYYGDEMTHDEIAVLLDCSRRHVGDLIERIHQALAAREGR